MLTSFFGKSNPVNFLILGLFIFFGFAAYVIVEQYEVFSWLEFLTYFVYCIICIISMLLVDFIIRKNALTRSNTLGIFFFSCFLLMLPMIIDNKNILFANVFILLALRRILSIRTGKNLEKKLLDASIWITIAAFFYTYCLLFFIVLLVSIIGKKETSYKHILIPFVGVLCVFILSTAYHFLVEGTFLWIFELDTKISIDFAAYSSFKILIPLTIILTLLVWSAVHRIYKLSTVPKKLRLNYLLILLTALVAVLVGLGSPQKTGAELLFLLAPVSIMMANYIEAREPNLNSYHEKLWFKESLMWLTVLLPVALFFT